MLTLIGALAAVGAVLFLVVFIGSLFCLRIDGWKELILFAAISFVCIGGALLIDGLLYEEVTVNEY